MPTTIHTGKVVHLTATGLAIVEESANDAGTTAVNSYGFNFDKIKGYRGESASEIGLRIGTQVKFTAEGETVREVFLPTVSPLPT